SIRHIVVDDRVVDRIINDRRVADDSRIVNHSDIPLFIDVIVGDVGAGDILLRHKVPVMWWRVIASAKRGADAYARTERGPAIIIVAPSPADPCRRPVIARDPHPAISVLEKPAAIVKSGPAPIVIR